MGTIPRAFPQIKTARKNVNHLPNLTILRIFTHNKQSNSLKKNIFSIQRNQVVVKS